MLLLLLVSAHSLRQKQHSVVFACSRNPLQTKGHPKRCSFFADRGIHPPRTLWVLGFLPYAFVSHSFAGQVLLTLLATRDIASPKNDYQSFLPRSLLKHSRATPKASCHFLLYNTCGVFSLLNNKYLTRKNNCVIISQQYFMGTS